MGLDDRLDSLQENLDKRFARLLDFAAGPPGQGPGLRQQDLGDHDYSNLTSRYLGAGSAHDYSGLTSMRSGTFGNLGAGEAFPSLYLFQQNTAGLRPVDFMRADPTIHTAKWKEEQAAMLAEKADKGTATTSSNVTGVPGMEANVARWAPQTRATFGTLIDPDVMLAIMTNESHGNPDAYNPDGDAWGLFQNVGLGSKDPEKQFAAAYTLAQQKLASITQSYQANGLDPDARTRARDFALAWAGHFDYDTGKPNPRSRDVGSGQTADELAAIFLKNYDTIKAGGATAATRSGGIPGTMNAIWGGSQQHVNQDFGEVNPDVPQSIYAYGKTDYGTNGGHTGLDIGLKRGTQLYSPGSGYVEIAGGSGYYGDEDYGDPLGRAPGRGELRLHLDDGTIVILGHTSQINVKQGDRVTPGMLVGLSGSATGDHLHLEVRVPDRSLRSGYRIVDPRTYFGRGPAGGGGQLTP